MGEASPLRAELIRHISDDITHQTEFLHTLRSRMAFTVLLGPFLVLGSFVVAASKPRLVWPGGAWPWVGLVAAVCCYVGLGIYGYKLDRHLSKQCDFWRTVLMSVIQYEPLEEIRLEFPRKIRNQYAIAYLPGFCLVLGCFAGLAILVLSVLAQDNQPAKPPCGLYLTSSEFRFDHAIRSDAPPNIVWRSGDTGWGGVSSLDHMAAAPLAGVEIYAQRARG
jgi:hypothetical protein